MRLPHNSKGIPLGANVKFARDYEKPRISTVFKASSRETPHHVRETVVDGRAGAARPPGNCDDALAEHSRESQIAENPHEQHSFLAVSAPGTKAGDRVRLQGPEFGNASLSERLAEAIGLAVGDGC